MQAMSEFYDTGIIKSAVDAGGADAPEQLFQINFTLGGTPPERRDARLWNRPRGSRMCG